MSLVALAHQAGFGAVHVNYMGMGGLKDWQLMQVIRDDEYTLVTNNRIDFVALYRRQEVHPGLVVVVPNVPPAQQRLLFQAALKHIGRRDLLNTVIEVDKIGEDVRCLEYPLPSA